jgi:hypothetical protein
VSRRKCQKDRWRSWVYNRGRVGDFQGLQHPPHSVHKNKNIHTEQQQLLTATFLEDFQDQKGRLQEEVENLGHRILFYIKFHCELNFIERYWYRTKWFAREHCEYGIHSFQAIVLDARMMRWIEALVREWQQCPTDPPVLSHHRDFYRYCIGLSAKLKYELNAYESKFLPGGFGGGLTISGK